MKLQPVEMVCLIAACIAEAAFAFLVFVARPQFVKMFADFGGSLPDPTQWMLGDIVPFLLAGIPSLCIIGAFTMPKRRTLLLVLASVAAAFNLFAFFVALYLPLWTIAGSIN